MAFCLSDKARQIGIRDTFLARSNPSALRLRHSAATSQSMEKAVSRAGNWRLDARITFNTTEAVQAALKAAAAEGYCTDSDVAHELAIDWGW